MRNLDDILKNAHYTSCWYLRSSRPLDSNLSDRFLEIGVNEEGWLAEDVNGNQMYNKIDVDYIHLGVNVMVKIAFEI